MTPLLRLVAGLAAINLTMQVPATASEIKRDIPVPTTVSRELQAMLAQGGMVLPSLPTSNDGWLRFMGEPAEQQKLTQALLKRLDVTMSREQIAGVTCFVLMPKTVVSADKAKLLVHVHGGAYVLGAGENGTWEGIMLAAAAKLPVVAIDYRMPPDHPFPAAMDDAMAVWKALLKRHRARDMAIFGTSTGGAMALLMAQRARQEKVALPAAVIAGSPWSDLSKTGDSYYVNELTTEPLYDGFLRLTAKSYANGVDLKDPRLSPVYGDFTDFPPTMLLSGTRDIFLSNTVRVQRKLLDAGVITELDVYEAQPHAAYLDPTLPEAAQAFNDMARFLRRHFAAAR